jgi:hypothetical protein
MKKPYHLCGKIVETIKMSPWIMAKQAECRRKFDDFGILRKKTSNFSDFFPRRQRGFYFSFINYLKLYCLLISSLMAHNMQNDPAKRSHRLADIRIPITGS